MADTKSDALIVFTPSGKRGRFPIGTPVLQAARSLGVDIDSVCGGRAICGRCQITIGEGEFAKHGISSTRRASVGLLGGREQRYDEKRGLQAGAAAFPARRSFWAMWSSTCRPRARFTSRWCANAQRRATSSINPVARLHYIEVEEPDMHKPSSDLERVYRALADAMGGDKVSPAICDIIRQLQKTLRQGEWKVTAAVYRA